MERDPLFLSEETIHDFHAEQLRLFGGSEGIRDSGGFSSAVAAPLQLYLYGTSVDLFDLAACYAYHISQSQAFVDGNKRTALQAALAFIRVNGFSVESEPAHLFDKMLGLHSGAETKAAFANHLRNCSVRRGGFTEWLRRVLGL